MEVFHSMKVTTSVSVHGDAKAATTKAAVEITSKQDGATSGANTTMSHVVTGGDYITVDITQIGSNTAGENLYMVFTFS